MEIVLSCPNCNSNAVYVDDVSKRCGKPTYNVSCEYCGCISTADTREEAIRKWNMRGIYEREGK